MADIRALRKLLAEEYGIRTDQELQEAIRKMMNRDIEALLEWRDQHIAEVRSHPAPLKAVEIICKERWEESKMYRIVGSYQGKPEEVIDQFRTKKEAELMLAEYSLAFGSGWTLNIKGPKRRGTR